MTARVSKLLALPAALVLLVSGCGGGGGQSDASAKQEITTTWEAFFNGGKGSVAQLQDGDKLQQVFQQNLSNPSAKASTAKVHTVDLLKKSDCDANAIPSPCAQVTYDILVNGTPALPNSKGYATKQGGHWKVSKATFCALIALGNGGTPPPGC